MKKTFLLFTLLSGLMFARAQTKLVPVEAESKVHFVIKNFGFKTGGDFTGIKGQIQFDPVNFASSVFDVTVEAKTIDTDNGTRDEHLREAEYFDVEKFPTIAFKSTKVVQSTKAGRFYMYGNLTIKGVTRPIEFGFGATAKNGGYFFDGQFEINRRDFGVGGSSVSMSDMLTVSLKVQAN